MESAQSTLEMVCAYLDDAEIPYSVHEEANIIDTVYRGESGIFTMRISVLLDPPQLNIFIIIPTIIPESRRVEMAETITRANYGSLMGCFEMDMSSGNLYCRASMPIVDYGITSDQFWHLVAASTIMIDYYYPAFNRLLYGDDLTPAEVIAEVEMRDDNFQEFSK